MSSPGEDDQRDPIRNGYRALWEEASDWEFAQLDFMGRGAGQADADVNDILNSGSWAAWNPSPPVATSDETSRHAPPLPPSSAAAAADVPLEGIRQEPHDSILDQAAALRNLHTARTPFLSDSARSLPFATPIPAPNRPVSSVLSGETSNRLPPFHAPSELVSTDYFPGSPPFDLFDSDAAQPAASSPNPPFSPVFPPPRLPNTDPIADVAGHMPSRTQRRAQAPAVVDLTVSSSSPPTNAIRPPSSHAHTASRARETRGTKRQRPPSIDEEAELIDEAPSAEEELLRAQQEETIRAQQAADESGQQRIGRRQCIICMESYTNATVTSCGHFYCHECLTQALKAGEKHRENGSGMGNCPVCRKPLSRNNKKKRDMFPVVFMTRAGFEENKRKRMDVMG